jgi:rubrerythrin
MKYEERIKLAAATIDDALEDLSSEEIILALEQTSRLQNLVDIQTTCAQCGLYIGSMEPSQACPRCGTARKSSANL